LKGQEYVSPFFVEAKHYEAVDNNGFCILDCDEAFHLCRMLGIVSSKPIPSCYLRDFQALAHIGRVFEGAKDAGHKDGWGITYFDKGIPTYLDRQPTDALKDERYAVALEKMESLQISGVVLAHLRRRSVGTVSMENTLPFTHGTWAFAHNGTIFDFDAKIEGEREDVTDSKRFFQLLVREIETGNSRVEEAIGRVVNNIRNTCRHSSLTFLLSNGAKLYAYRDFAEAKNEGYYSLMYAKEDGMVLFSQEPTWRKDWFTVSNRCLVIVDEDLRINCVEL